MAQEQYTGRLDDGDTIQRGKFTLTARIHHDESHGAPWDEEDGHGPVSDWTTRDKLPSELVLASDRSHKRFYDFKEACAIARRDEWGTAPFDVPGEGPKSKAARAALADFDRLRQWCSEQWSYVGIEIVASSDGIKLGSASFWGIESDAGDYLTDTANELCDEALEEAREAIARLAA